MGKRLKSNKNSTNHLKKISKITAFNTVQTNWQTRTKPPSPRTLKKSIKENITEHNKNIDNFFTIKEALSQNQSTDNKDTFDKYLSLLLGWLAQPYWELLIPRYNLDCPKPNEESLIKLLDYAQKQAKIPTRYMLPVPSSMRTK